MHISRMSLRLVALLAAIVGAMLAFNSLPPGPEGALANTPAAITGVSCADIYLDLIPTDGLPDDRDGNTLIDQRDVIGKSLSRTEAKVPPSATSVDITTVTYLGPDQDGNLLPDRPPSDNDCQHKKDHAEGTAGAFDFQITPPAGAWNRVDIFIQQVTTTPKAKSVLFTCHQGPSISDPVETVAGKFKSKSPGGIENWSAEFAKKCVGTGFPPVIVNIKPTNPLDPVSLGQIVGCTVENTKDKTPPAPGTCTVSALGPKLPGEENRLDKLVKYQMVDNDRPTVNAQIVGSNVVFSTCVFSETQGMWVRTDVTTSAVNKGPNAKNTGTAVLYLGVTSAPACATHGPEAGAAQCGAGNVTDDDGDSAINDGCPAVGAAEQGAGCGKNAIDNDGDGFFNDGCPAVSSFAFPALLLTHGRAATTDNAVLNPGTPLDPDGVAGDPVPMPQPPDADLLADDWDGDGCTDWDELSPGFKSGRDPFNPNDCDKNFNGVYNILATQTAATKDAAGNVVPGQYFHCIGAIVHDKTGVLQPLDASLQCAIDSPALSTLSGSAVPTRADGLAGPPPPPPYNTAAPSNLNGTYDTVTNTLTLTGCFPNVGGSLGPNIIVEATINGKSLKGTAIIHGNQTIAACTAKTPNNTGPGVIKLPITVALSEQADAFDHDKDGCSDWNELKKTTPATLDRCGDDPYNPYDSDTDFNSVGSVQVTVGRADWDKAAGVVIPGVYFHCISDNNPNTGTADPNDFFSRLMCYVDTGTGVTEVNPQGYPGVFGGGLPGDPPPRNQAPEVFGDVDGTHTQLNGSYNKVTNRLIIYGCFQNIEPAPASAIQLGPSVYTIADVDAHTGIGTVQIYRALVPAACKAATPASPPAGTPLPGAVEIAEQFSKTGVTPPNVVDTDLDGCTDKQELRAAAVMGGLRDPYNGWDFMDQWIGGAKNRSISGGDIGAVVARFGAVGSPKGDPLVPPKATTGYHVAADRAGSMAGSNIWNLRPPNGSISGGDIGAVVAQFGHFCTT